MTDSVGQLVGFTRTLSREALTSEVLHEAKRRVIDTLACALGGGHGAHPSDNLGGVLAAAESVHASGAGCSTHCGAWKTWPTSHGSSTC